MCEHLRVMGIGIRDAALPLSADIARPDADWLVQNNVGGQIPAAVTPPDQMRPWARTTDEPVTLTPVK